VTSRLILLACVLTACGANVDTGLDRGTDASDDDVASVCGFA